ncbi:hypothetical protein JOC73_003009 [Alkaliphilus hydrothermalis]|uniref:Uncharacterized protein n=2 Tax=Alkaliphilus hydrothermalis TaxID=1482730 RepID=A0ABS2NU14_9FIRM|nr:hypothetical protein [Alkaliphilus hydrothermalis]
MGGPDKQTPLKRKECCWSIQTEYTESIDLSTEMSKLYDVLKDKTDIINDIQKEFSAKCKFIIVMILSENPIKSRGTVLVDS